jgi:hypothetical protein
MIRICKIFSHEKLSNFWNVLRCVHHSILLWTTTIYILPPFTCDKKLVKFLCIENSNVLMKCSNYHFFLIMSVISMWH